jgi:hypothetical protein
VKSTVLQNHFQMSATTSTLSSKTNSISKSMINANQVNAKNQIMYLQSSSNNPVGIRQQEPLIQSNTSQGWTQLPLLTQKQQQMNISSQNSDSRDIQSQDVEFATETEKARIEERHQQQPYHNSDHHQILQPSQPIVRNYNVFPNEASSASPPTNDLTTARHVSNENPISESIAPTRSNEQNETNN